MLSLITPTLMSLAMVPASEALILIGTAFIAGFIAWQALKISAKAVGNLIRLTKESSKVAAR
jgi:hypothetical protein